MADEKDRRGWKGMALATGLICLTSAGLMLLRVSEPFGGFMGYNEAWYSIIAKNYETHGLLYPTTYEGKLDFNLPPFFSYMLYGSFSLLGASEATARLVPILSSLLCLCVIYRLASLLYGWRAGAFSCVLFASFPCFILVGRNVQADMPYLLFLLASLYFYLKSKRSSLRLNLSLSGLLFGLALFTKQFAIFLPLILFIFECKEHRGLGWLRKELALWVIVAALVPGSFYLFHLVKAPHEMIEAQRGGAAGLAGLPSPSMAWLMLKETFWALSPFGLLTSLISLAFLAWRRQWQDVLLIIGFATYLVFFVFFHKHTYYLLSMVPFLGIMAGWGLSSLRVRESFQLALLLIVTSTSLLCSLLILNSNKYGYGEFKQLGRLAQEGQRVAFLAEELFLDSYSSLIMFYLPEAQLIPLEKAPRDGTKVLLPEGERTYFLDLRPRLLPPRQGVLELFRDHYGFALGDRFVTQLKGPTHYFTPGRPQIVPLEGIEGQSLIRKLREHTMSAVEVQEGQAVYVKTQKEDKEEKILGVEIREQLP